MTKHRGASKMSFRHRGKALPTVEFNGRPSVLELAISHRLPLEHSCGGMGTCGTCRVIVRSELEQLPPRTEVELEIANDREFEPRERLACQTQAVDGLEVEIPD